MRRSITAVALFVSFVAMSTSGVLMLIMDRPSFTIRMHPVHKLFGIVMVLAMLSHLTLNARALLAHTRNRWALVGGGLLTVLLVMTYAVVVASPVAPEAAKVLDQAAREMEDPPENPSSVRATNP